MNTPKHANKHIRNAIRYAESEGWRVTKAGPRAHYGVHYVRVKVVEFG